MQNIVEKCGRKVHKLTADLSLSKGGREEGGRGGGGGEKSRSVGLLLQPRVGVGIFMGLVSTESMISCFRILFRHELRVPVLTQRGSKGTS